MNIYEQMTFEEFINKYDSLKEYPNMAKYIYAHGFNDLLIVPWVVRDADSAEKVYKECIEKGVTWRELKK